MKTIVQILEHHAVNRPQENLYTFLKSDDQRQTRTYGELHQRVQEIAQALLENAQPGDRALLMYPPGLEFIEAFLGCLAAGIVAVPAYPPKKNRNAERILSIAKDCAPRLLLCTGETQRSIEGDFANSISGALVVATDELLSSQKRQLPELSADELAFLQYTSGSTANPKGAMVTHGNIVANEMHIQRSFAFSEQSIMVSWLPMFHDMGLIGGILAPLFVGFSSVLMPPNSFLWRPLKWLQAVSDFRGTCTGAPNFAYDLCVTRIKKEEKLQLDLSSLRIAYNGSEPIRAETLRNFTSAFSECGLHPQACFPCYGLAETTLLVSGGPPLTAPNIVTLDQNELEKHRVVESSTGREIVSCGQVSPALPVRIVNPKTLMECLSDEIGEVWASGESIVNGYLSCPEETSHAFGARLHGSTNSWFRTGDYGFIRNSHLYITGRLKDLIIIRGRNIYPQDIERRIEEIFQLESPNSVAAFMVEVNGNETVGVVAEASKSIHQLAKESKTNAGDDIIDRLNGFRSMVRMSREWVSRDLEATLSHLCIVTPGTFPRTSSGKIMRIKIANDFERGALSSLKLPMTTSWEERSQAT